MKIYESTDKLYKKYIMLYRSINFTIFGLLIVLVCLFIYAMFNPQNKYFSSISNILGFFAFFLSVIKFYFDTYKTNREYFVSNPFIINIFVKKEHNNIKLYYEVESRFFKESTIRKLLPYKTQRNILLLKKNRYLISELTLPLINEHKYEVTFVFQSIIFNEEFVKNEIYISQSLINNKKFEINGKQYNIMQG